MAWYCKVPWVNFLYGTSDIDWCICVIHPAEQKVVQIKLHPVAILSSPLKVMSLLEEDVKIDTIAK